MKVRPAHLKFLEHRVLIEILTESLNSVDESYLRTTYQNVNAIRTALSGRGVFENETFYRYGERVFCYEFYHQMRRVLDSNPERFSKLFNGAVLQGEVNKMQIIELVEHFGLENLNGEYAPDFLIHTPGTADHHSCVIEVKCNPHLTKNEFLKDIDKLNQFITRYNYNWGFFIAVNITAAKLTQIIESSQEEIDLFAGRSEITIISKESYDSNVSLINV